MKKCDILRTSSGRRENAFCPDRPVNMLQSVPSATHLDVHRSIPDLSTLEREVFGCSEKMTISSLRTIRTAVFASSPVRVMFVQPSRHRWQGVLKFSARSAISLPIGSDGRLNFGNHRISNLLNTGVSLMAKFPLGTRRSGIRLGTTRRWAFWFTLTQPVRSVRVRRFQTPRRICGVLGRVRTGFPGARTGEPTCSTYLSETGVCSRKTRVGRRRVRVAVPT